MLASWPNLSKVCSIRYVAVILPSDCFLTMLSALGLFSVSLAATVAVAQKPLPAEAPFVADVGVRRLPPVPEDLSARPYLLPPSTGQTDAAPIAVPGAASVDLAVEERVEVEDVAVVETAHELWQRSVEFGIVGTGGNSESLNVRAGGHLVRDGPMSKLTLDIHYKRVSQDFVETANRLYFEGRNEWDFQDSPLIGFLHGTVEFDEFLPYDSRVTTDLGWGYKLLDLATTKIIGRVGSGVAREIGGPANMYVPEGMAGLDAEHRLTRRQRMNAKVEYFPDWTQPGEYRMNSTANWELLFDAEANLSLKLGVINRYDSTPNGAARNDLDYSLVLLLGF